MPSHQTILWIYIAFLVVGGLIGFFKAKSKASLISSTVSAAILVLCATNVLEPRYRTGIADVVMAVLLVVFAMRLAKTRKFMPSGMLLVVTLAALILRHMPL